MDKKSIGIVRHALRSGEPVIEKIYTCYYEDGGNVLMMNTENASTAAMTEECVDAYKKILRKVLTGIYGKRVFGLTFTDNYKSKSQKMLCKAYPMDADTDNVKELFENIIENYEPSGRALIIIAKGILDIPAGKDEDSEDVYEFMICCTCLAEGIKDGLKYAPDQTAFVDVGSEKIIKRPEFGFLFPALSEGTPDIHEVLYFSKEEKPDSRIVSGVLGCRMPSSWSEQKEVFQQIVEEALGREGTVENVSAVYGAVGRFAVEQDALGESTEMDSYKIGKALENSGIPDKAVEAIKEGISESAENGTELNARGVGSPSGNITIENEYVTIFVDSKYTDKVMTKVIDGIEYIVLPAAGMTINGISSKSAK